MCMSVCVCVCVGWVGSANLRHIHIAREYVHTREDVEGVQEKTFRVCKRRCQAANKQARTRETTRNKERERVGEHGGKKLRVTNVLCICKSTTLLCVCVCICKSTILLCVCV